MLNPARLEQTAQLCTTLAFLLGSIALTGWLGNWPALRSFGPQYIPMAPNTAICFMLAAGALLASQSRRSALRAVAAWGSLPVLLLGGIRLFEFAWGWQLRVDTWLMDVPAVKFGLVPVGQMALPTAVGMVMCGSALWIHVRGRGRTGRVACAVMGVVVSFLGLMFSLGYVYGRPLLYGGEVIPMALNTAMAFSLFGLGLFLASTAREMAVHRAADEDLRRTRQFLDSIVENIPNMVFVKDARELRFVLFNRAGEALLGHPRQALMGKNDYDLFPREQADFFLAKDRETLRGGALVEVAEEPIFTGALQTRILHTKKLALLDAAGRPEYLLGISEDITERKEAEKQIQELNRTLSFRAAQLEAANGELEAFAYSVSHDLRAPLRHIVGFGALLKRSLASTLDGKSAEHLETMIESAQRMGKLIDDLLAFSRSGRAEMATERVDLNRVVEDVRRELESQDRSRAITWRIAPLPQVHGDRSMLHQVMVNLMSNACKFTRHRSPAEIEIGASDQGVEVVLYVRDNGSGFNMQYANKLFGVFQRLHSDAEFEGTGIGLANVRRIVTKHGGRTWAEGTVDAGATSYFSLPRTAGETPHERTQAHFAC